MTTLLIVKCYACGTILAKIDAPPADWNESYWFPRCKSPRCRTSIPSHDRWFEGSGRYALGGLIPWKDLRSKFEEAWRKGKPSTIYVRIGKPEEFTR